MANAGLLGERVVGRLVHRRWPAAVVAVALSGLAISTAQASLPAVTTPTAVGAPYVSVAHQRLFDGVLPARSGTSFAALGSAGLPAAGVAAVVLLVSVPAPSAAGSVVAYPAGATRPAVSSVSFSAGHAAVATVVVAPGVRGRLALGNGAAARVHLAVTVVGYYAAPGTAGAAHAATAFEPVPGRRLASSSVPAAGSVVVAVAGVAHVPSTGVAAVLLSVGVVAPVHGGGLAVYPYHSTAPAHSSIAFVARQSSTALLVLRPGASGRVVVANRSGSAVRVTADVVGYLRALRLPGPPASVTATAQNGGAVVSWLAPSSTGGTPLLGYRVVASPGGETVLTDGTAHGALVSGLANGTPYTFTVAAQNSVGTGPASAVSAATTPSATVGPLAAPGPPAVVHATASGPGQVTVNWPAPATTGVDGYQVTTSPGLATTAVGTTQATVTGLTAGQVYSFTVRTVVPAGVSIASVPSNFAIGEGTSPVGVALGGGTADGTTGGFGASISGDGRYVAFGSDADDLVVGDTNHASDVFVTDRLTGTTTLVSAAAGLTSSANGASDSPSLSADGRYVAFDSTATNLASGTHPVGPNVYVRDLTTGITTLLSAVGSVGGNNASLDPVISGDGSTVAFMSAATDLVPGDTNDSQDVFVVSLATRVITRASLGAGGVQADGDSFGPALSADGRYVAMVSDATNLVPVVTGGHEQVYLRDLAAGTTALVSVSTSGVVGNDASDSPAISADGRDIAFASAATNVFSHDTNQSEDVLIRDVVAGTTTPLMLPHGDLTGVLGNDNVDAPSLSADGRYVTVSCCTENHAFTNVFRVDRSTGATLRVSVPVGPADGDSNGAVISADGQHVVFVSSAHFVPGGVSAPYWVRDLG